MGLDTKEAWLCSCRVSTQTEVNELICCDVIAYFAQCLAQLPARASMGGSSMLRAILRTDNPTPDLPCAYQVCHELGSVHVYYCG